MITYSYDDTRHIVIVYLDNKYVGTIDYTPLLGWRYTTKRGHRSLFYSTMQACQNFLEGKGR